jgi:hypothetical protein
VVRHYSYFPKDGLIILWIYELLSFLAMFIGSLLSWKNPSLMYYVIIIATTRQLIPMLDFEDERLKNEPILIVMRIV